jgi:hypothetical protein
MAKHGDLITDGGVTWRVVDRRTHGKVADIPNYFQRSKVMVGSTNTIITPSKLQININNQGFIGESASIDLNLVSNWDTDSAGFAVQGNRPGKDFYVYLVQTNNGKLKFILSYNSTVPSGYTADTSRKIGGFHCLCTSVGSISGHSLEDLLAGEILPDSVWDLLHRPISEPEGMVWVEDISKWVDIYLSSWDATNNKLVSIYGGITADGASSPKWHGEKFAEYLGLVGKRLPMRDEFMVFAKGSNEMTAITSSVDGVTTGGHVDTANRRMISNYGIEDCCGFLYQWSNNIKSNQGTTSWATTSVYDSTVDSQEYGSCYYGPCDRAQLGGCWNDSTNCGSRCVHFQFASSNVNGARGARGVSKPKPEL